MILTFDFFSPYTPDHLYLVLKKFSMTGLGRQQKNYIRGAERVNLQNAGVARQLLGDLCDKPISLNPGKMLINQQRVTKRKKSYNFPPV